MHQLITCGNKFNSRTIRNGDKHDARIWLIRKMRMVVILFR